jgi:hypothetical protein
MFNTELVPAITSEEALNHLKIWQVSYNQLNDPGIDFSGWWKDEAEVRNKPGLFFLQVSEGYWKGLTFVRINNGWFPAGYYELITLQDLNDQLFIFSRHPRTKGRVIIIHGKHACNAVDAIKMKGDEVSLQVVASNFNVIETVNQSNFNKLFKLYCIDRTLGPILMTRNAFASMVLLHVFNCKGVKIFPFPFGSPLNNFIQKTRGQIEFNLLHRFGILTSAGYAVSGLKEDFKEKINDANFAAICVRHSPAVARFKFSKKLLSGEICLNNLFIYASLSTKPGYCKALKNLEPSIQEEHIEANLRRYYKSVLLYAKLNKLETVCAPFLGSGVFGVPFYYHSKILDELGNEILDSGITLIINAFCGYSNKNNSSVHVRNVKWPNYVQLLDVSGFKSFAQVVNEITNHISA